MHLTQIQNHLAYQMPSPTQYMHPLSHTDHPFPLYDPWPIPTPALATGDLQSRGDKIAAGDAPSDTF